MMLGTIFSLSEEITPADKSEKIVLELTLNL